MKNQKILRRRTIALFAILLLILTLFGGCVQMQEATPSAEPSLSPATAKRYMAENKNVFFVVGIGHMLGDGGIVDLLKQDGYTVEKVA